MKRKAWWLFAATGLLLLETRDVEAFARGDQAARQAAQVLQEDAWGPLQRALHRWVIAHGG